MDLYIATARAFAVVAGGLAAVAFTGFAVLVWNFYRVGGELDKDRR